MQPLNMSFSSQTSDDRLINEHVKNISTDVQNHCGKYVLKNGREFSVEVFIDNEKLTCLDHSTLEKVTKKVIVILIKKELFNQLNTIPSAARIDKQGVHIQDTHGIITHYDSTAPKKDTATDYEVICKLVNAALKPNPSHMEVPLTHPSTPTKITSLPSPRHSATSTTTPTAPIPFEKPAFIPPAPKQPSEENDLKKKTAATKIQQRWRRYHKKKEKEKVINQQPLNQKISAANSQQKELSLSSSNQEKISRCLTTSEKINNETTSSWGSSFWNTISNYLSTDTDYTPRKTYKRIDVL